MQSAKTRFVPPIRSGSDWHVLVACTLKLPQTVLSVGSGNTAKMAKRGAWRWAVIQTLAPSRPRAARDAAKVQKSESVDPVQARKLEKLKNTRTTGDTFKAVALEWYAKQAPQWSESHAGRMLRQLERDLFPWMGERPIVEIHAMELLAVLQKVEGRGALETADRALMLARQIWNYWLPTTDMQQRNITEGLKARLTPYSGKSFAAIVEPLRMGDLLRAIKTYKGGPIVRTALQLAPMLYQRPGNLRDLEKSKHGTALEPVRARCWWMS